MTPRLEMNPADTAGCVDGGWWPRTLDPATAFPELAEALHPWVGPVGRVSYNLDLWEPAPRKQTVAGRVIRYEGFHTTDPHTVTVTGTNAHRVSLLVVPPHTPGGVARAVLRSAVGADRTATVADILASNGVPTQPVGTVPDQRGEAEGGHVRDTVRRPSPAR